MDIDTYKIKRSELYFLSDSEYNKLKNKTISFIRHGNSLANSYTGTLTEQRLDKSLIDSPLTDLGREQASLLKGKLNNNKYDIIISSPLSRAMETASIVFPNKKIKILNILTEVTGGWGDVGLEFNKCLSRNSDLKKIDWDLSEINYDLGEKWLNNKLWSYIDEGGYKECRPYESEHSAQCRIRQFWKWVLERDYSNIVVVGHSKLFGRPENKYGILLDRALECDKEFRNCEMVIVKFDDFFYN